MLKQPNCLEIPTLYEGALAQILWESVPEALGYELDCSFDEDFASGSRGLTWTNIAQRQRTWKDAEAKGYSWGEFEIIPEKNYLAYKGPGEETPGPYHGLTWAFIDSGKNNWQQMEDAGRTWKSIEFHLESDADSLKKNTYRAHTIPIPMNKKKALFRVQSYNDEAYSPHHNSDFIPIVPVFYREDSTSLEVVENTEFLVQLHLHGVEKFANIFITLAYNPELLELKSMDDFLLQKRYGVAAAKSGDSKISVIANEKGAYRFQYTKPVPAGSQSSGRAIICRFVAKQTGAAHIRLH